MADRVPDRPSTPSVQLVQLIAVQISTVPTGMKSQGETAIVDLVKGSHMVIGFNWQRMVAVTAARTRSISAFRYSPQPSPLLSSNHPDSIARKAMTRTP